MTRLNSSNLFVKGSLSSVDDCYVFMSPLLFSLCNIPNFSRFTVPLQDSPAACCTLLLFPSSLASLDSDSLMVAVQPAQLELEFFPATISNRFSDDDITDDCIQGDEMWATVIFCIIYLSSGTIWWKLWRDEISDEAWLMTRSILA